MKKLLAALCGVIVVALLGMFCVIQYQNYVKQEFVRSLGMGINIGNSLDSHGMREYHETATDLDFETSWGNPEIKKEMFETIKEAGFHTVRIPVTWMDHMDENGVVSEVWMDRVQEVVDLALENDLYVILNTHHEEWMNLEVDRKDEISVIYEGLWMQISNRFASYDEKLLFEGMNEPRLRDSEYEWTSGTEELRNMVNDLNAIFMDVVRSGSEYNEERFLLIPSYAAKAEAEAMEGLIVSKGNVIVSLHIYEPYSFCQKEDGSSSWDDQTEEADAVVEIFQDIDQVFLKNKIPVVITEFGCIDKNNQTERVEWVQFYKSLAEEAQIPLIWWDNGGNYQLLNRKSCEWTNQELLHALTEK